MSWIKRTPRGIPACAGMTEGLATVRGKSHIPPILPPDRKQRIGNLPQRANPHRIHQPSRVGRFSAHADCLQPFMEYFSTITCTLYRVGTKACPPYE